MVLRAVEVNIAELQNLIQLNFVWQRPSKRGPECHPQKIKTDAIESPRVTIRALS
jgi:hypothetical protein